MKTVYEVYFDKSENDLTFDNFSWFIKADHMPTREEAIAVLTPLGRVEDGYHILFIIESDWEDLEESDIVEI